MSIKIRTYPSGKRVATVTLRPGESVQIVRAGEQGKALRQDGFYRLGGSHDDVVSGDVIADARRVAWCNVMQEWTPT